MRSIYIKTIILASGLLLAGIAPKASAQGPIEAYRLGLQGSHGTARAQALGGAVGAVGADPTAVYVNPAGIALYTRGIFSFTVDPGASSTTVRWGDISRSTDASLGGFNNLSYVGTLVDNYRSGFRINVGLSYNRTYDFDKKYDMQTGRMQHGLADFISLVAMDQGRPFKDYWWDNTYNPFNTSVHPLVTMGVSSGLIEGVAFDGTDPQNSQLFRPAISEPDYRYADTERYRHILLPEQSRLSVAESGGKSAFDINLGMGFEDRFFLGAALRLSSISYGRVSSYGENFHYSDPSHNINNNSHFTLKNAITTKGASVGLNLGAIVMLGDYVRLGVSYMTPEYVRLDETYHSTLSVYNDVNDPKYKSSDFSSGEYVSSYSMKTAGQITASAMAFLGSYGFVSYDYSYRNLGTTVLYHDGGYRSGLSDFIKEDYGAEHTHRFGVEIKAMPRLALRAGFSHTSNPMVSGEFRSEPASGLTQNAMAVGTMPDFTLPRTYTTYSAGLGYKFTSSLTLDLAYVRSDRSEQVYPFSGYVNTKGHLDAPSVVVKGGKSSEIRNNLVATLTLSF